MLLQLTIPAREDNHLIAGGLLGMLNGHDTFIRGCAKEQRVIGNGK